MLGEFYIRSRRHKNMKSYMTPYFMLEEEKKWIDDSRLRFREFDPESNLYDIEQVIRAEGTKRSAFDF